MLQAATSRRFRALGRWVDVVSGNWPGDHQHDPLNHPGEDDPYVYWHVDDSYADEPRPVVTHDCFDGIDVVATLPYPKWRIVNAEGPTGLRVVPSFHCTRCGCHVFLVPENYREPTS